MTQKQKMDSSVMVLHHKEELSVTELRQIGESLAMNDESRIEVISFRDSKIGDDGILAFQQGLMENFRLRSSCQEVDDETESVRRFPLPELQELDVSNTGLGIRGLRVLLRLDSACPKLSKLDLSGNAFVWDRNTCNGFHAPNAPTLEAWPIHRPWFRTIQDLDMRDCAINDDLATTLFNHMTTSPFGYHYDDVAKEAPLRILHLSNNPIRDLKSLRWILPNIEELYLSNCSLTDDTLDWMVDYLDPLELGNQMNLCRIMDLSNNNLTTTGVQHLSTCFRFVTPGRDDEYGVSLSTKTFDQASLPNITNLNLSGNPLGSTGIFYFVSNGLRIRRWGNKARNVNFEADPSAVSTLNLSNTNCGKEGVQIALEHASEIGLKHLYLASNDVGHHADLDRWLEQSQAARTLQLLDLSDNELDGETVLAALHGLDIDLKRFGDYALQHLLFGPLVYSNDDQRMQINDIIRELQAKYGIEISCI